MGPAKGAMSATIESGAAARSADDPPTSLRSDQRLRFTAFFVGKLLASMMKPPSSRACDHLEPRWAQLSYFAVLQPKLDISRMESVVTSKSCHFLERLYFLERHIRDAASQFVRI
jgi:hypothetical protein